MLAGTSHGFLYQASVPARRPASHFTPRLVPATSRLSPLESGLIVWHH